MSATSQDRRPVTELLSMDEQTAKHQLSYAEYQRWESLNDHHERAAENRQELAEDDAAVHDLLVNTDPSDLAVDVSIWGNDLAVYYGPEDAAIQSAAERLAEAFDVDADSDIDQQAETLTADDVDGESLREAKTALGDLVCAAIVSWNGTAWQSLAESDREAIRTQITASRPEGWGLAGLMDAWVEIQSSVEQARDDRLERVRKFRSPERRGNR